MAKSVRPAAVSIPIGVRTVEPSQMGAAAETGAAARATARVAAWRRVRIFMRVSSWIPALAFGAPPPYGPPPVRPAESLDPTDTVLRQPVGGQRGRNRLGARDLEDASHVGVNAAGQAHGRVAIVADELAIDADQAPGVDYEVRRVKNAAVVQLQAVAPLVGKLVVGGAGHDLAAQPGNRLVVERRAQGARGHDVARHLEDFARGHDLDAELVAGAVRGLRVDVGREDLGARLAEEPRQVVADVAETLHGHRAALERGVAGMGGHGRLDALEDAEGGDRRGVAATAVLGRHAGDPARFVLNDLHVVEIRAHVLG